MNKRDKLICDLREQDKYYFSFGRLAKMFSLSRQRVHQIYSERPHEKSIVNKFVREGS